MKNLFNKVANFVKNDSSNCAFVIGMTGVFTDLALAASLQGATLLNLPLSDNLLNCFPSALLLAPLFSSCAAATYLAGHKICTLVNNAKTETATQNKAHRSNEWSGVTINGTCEDVTDQKTLPAGPHMA